MVLKEMKAGVIAYHDELVTEYLNQSDIKFRYKVLDVEPERVAMLCVMKKGSTRYTAVGEATPENAVKESQKGFLFTLASDRAFDHAMIALLGLGRNVKSNLDVRMSPSLLRTKPEEEEMTEEKAGQESSQPEQAAAEAEKPVSKAEYARLGFSAEPKVIEDVERSQIISDLLNKADEAEEETPPPAAMPEAVEQKEEPDDPAELTDETVVLVGQLKGKRIGQLRNDGRLPNLIRWAKTSRISYPEGSPEAAQLAALRALEYSPKK